jgi:tryptophanyl-tRNA synthetase
MNTSQKMQTDQIAVAGVRPTLGGIHLGHYVGNIRPLEKLSTEAETFFVLSDLNLLADLENPNNAADDMTSTLNMVADIVACGVNPDETRIFLQSQVASDLLPLAILLGGMINVARLERLPALKHIVSQVGQSFRVSTLMFPLLQVLDILSLRASFVCANCDNQTFVELSRELARKFNFRFGELFPQPQLVCGRVPMLVGTDGKKMSKSKENCFFLLDDTDTIHAKVMSMFTDPRRVHADIPGDTENNPVFVYHKLFNPDTEMVKDMEEAYRAGSIGDVVVKEALSNALENFIRPIRRQSRELRKKEQFLRYVLEEGREAARRVVKKTMESVSACTDLEAMNIYR